MFQPVTIRSLLDAAVHFGHQTRRWNPKMRPYIFGERNGVYILDLKQTLYGLDDAYSFVQQVAANGGTVLFVGTKKQAQEPIATHAERCNMPFVNHRWLGGMLTNFVTIHSRVAHMEELEAMEEEGRMAALPKKEQVHLRKELGKLQANLNGIREMKAIPQVVFVVDTTRESIVIREARQLGIPVVGIIDSNSDPDDVDFGIPGNDDAIRSVNLITEVIAEAVLAGQNRGTVSEAEIMAGIETELAGGTEAVGTETGDSASGADTPADAAVEAPTVAAAETSAVATAEASVTAAVEAAVAVAAEQGVAEAASAEAASTENAGAAESEATA
jgi:small subunit ribosomal protein S2